MTRPDPSPSSHPPAASVARRFEQLLGLARSGDSSGWRVASVALSGHSAVRLDLRHRDQSMTVRIQQAAETVDPTGQSWAVQVDGAGATRWARPLVEALARKLRGQSFQDIYGSAGGEVPEPQPAHDEAGPQDRPPTAEGPAAELPAPDFDMTAGEQRAGWCNFLCSRSFDMQMDQGLLPKNGFHSAFLADRECFYSSMPADERLYSPVDFPGIPLLGAGFEARSLFGFHDTGSKVFAVELAEPDVILGAGARAQELVEQASEQAADADVFHFTHMCTPTVMGEDLHQYGRQLERSTNAAVIHTSQLDLDKRVGLAGRLFAAIGRQADQASAAPEPDTINLLDFAPDPRDAELVPLLATMGLQVDCRLFPEVDTKAIGRFLQARKNVLPMHGFWASRLTAYLAELPRELLLVPSPYGIRGTRACLRQIAEGMDRGDGFEASWQRFWEPLQPTWDGLLRRAAEHRLGFVLTPTTVGYLASPEPWWGLDMLEVLGEMGFRVELLLYAPGSMAQEVDQATATLRSRHDELSVDTFGSEAQLHEQLRASRCAAFYSDFAADGRLLRAGKAVFSRRIFEQGAAGAVRTLQALLDLCDSPFFERYAAHSRSDGWRRSTDDG